MTEHGHLMTAPKVLYEWKSEDGIPMRVVAEGGFHTQWSAYGIWDDIDTGWGSAIAKAIATLANLNEELLAERNRFKRVADQTIKAAGLHIETDPYIRMCDGTNTFAATLEEAPELYVYLDAYKGATNAQA